MLKSLTLLIILIGFAGIFISQSFSYASASVPVSVNSSITKFNHSLISMDNELNIHLRNKKEQSKLIHLSNHMDRPLVLDQNYIYPVRGDHHFQVVVHEAFISAHSSTNLKLTIYADRKTRSGNYDFHLHFNGEDRSADIPIHIHLKNDWQSSHCHGHWRKMECGHK